MSNPYESGSQKVIPAVLVYLKYRDRVLMLHRHGQAKQAAGDYHEGKWNGLGGKLELGESPEQAAAREVSEEAGVSLKPEHYRPIGQILFPNFKAHKNEDWWVSVFVAELDSERDLDQRSCPEGVLAWVDSSKLLGLNLWPGDREFLPYIIKDQPFFGTIWYQGQEVLRSEVKSV